MDLATIFGFVGGFGFILAAITMHGSLKDFVDVPGAMVAFGGSTSALFIMFPMKKVLGVFGVVKKCFLTKLPDPREELKRFSQLAAISRRDGLLALEKQIPEINDPFLIRGLEMVIDGTPKEKLQEVLNTELTCIQERHGLGKKIFEQLGASLPAFGMVGTLIGLIQMLGSLDDPSKIGAGMAVAMVTTFYGAFVANMVYLPMAGKLEARSKEETLIREIMINGLVALVEGEAPRTIESRLMAFLAPKMRQLEQAAA
ncbi:MAG: motility protein A [Planctomycetes bacterium]|nr:motility protein A [Planctomycetota bacterium]